MLKFMIIFRQPEPAEIRSYEIAYNHLLAHVEKMPNILRRQVVSVLGSPSGPSDYYRVLEVYFRNREALDAALLSPEGQEAGAKLGAFRAGQVELLFAEVYEEEGGSTV